MIKNFADNSDILRCPRCQGKLDGEKCTQCNTQYDQTLGILDLRWPKPTQTNPKAATLISKIVENYPTATFQELVALRFQSSKLSSKIRADYQNYATNPQIRSQQMLNMFWEKVVAKFDKPAPHVALDLGCGVGASSAMLSHQFETVIGVDVDIISLLLAHKYFEEQEVTNVILVQAYAQALPLRDVFVNYAIAQNVLEHLFDVETALRELRRVLTVGGCFCGDSRNRFDLFLQEPHAKLRWVGFWPRRWQAWYVWQYRRMNYDHTRLLSLPELKRFAHRVFGASAFVVFPDSAAYGRSAKWDMPINVIERIPLIRWLFLFFFPSYLLISQVNPDPSQNKAQ